MSYATIDSSGHIAPSHVNSLTRNASLTYKRPKSSALGLTAITNTISNNFFKPEKLPLALQVRNEHRTVVKPFFTKNRKLLSTSGKRTTNIPNGFKNMLRAKSTVIKQKKLQQFYINHEARQNDVQKTHLVDFQFDSNHSNLFRSNFPMKRSKQRSINSVSLERKCKQKIINTNEEVQKLPAKAITLQSFTDDLSQMALRQKDIFQNKIKDASPKAKINWRNFKKKQRPKIDKENFQFGIEPWQGQEYQDVYF